MAGQAGTGGQAKMAGLPAAFTEKMKSLLKEEYGEFAKSYEKDQVRGLRANAQKAMGLALDFPGFPPLAKVPWAKEGYYYPASLRPGKHPWHEAGLYYIQEPSAMAAAELLDPKPGEWVLDLCAAPGGKTTHLAQKLGGKGFLLSNEIHPLRAKILSQNVERWGQANLVVLNEEPSKLAARFPEAFHRILVDAPCSGEGMFRKDQAAREEWSLGQVALCAARQRQILAQAAAMLKPGGWLAYSTCTFSPEENEGTLQWFLETYPEFSIWRGEGHKWFAPGRPDWIPKGRTELADTYRIWPHQVEGEGHYVGILRKAEGPEGRRKTAFQPYVKDKALLAPFMDFVNGTLGQEPWRGREEYLLFGEQLYLVPPQMPDMKGLKVVRPGLHLGTMKKNRFEPSHALALFLEKSQASQWVSMDGQGEEAVRYLKGEALPAQGNWQAFALSGKGWVLMCVDGRPLGWAKLSGGILKNHYPKGLRWR